MKEYCLIVEGEHVSFERRRLRFGDFQRNQPKHWDCDQDASYDDGDFGKWFRLDTVSISVVEYDDDGNEKTIATPYRNGHIVDDRFVQIFDDPFDKPPEFACERIARRSCMAWGEFETEDFSLDQLAIYKEEKQWENGERVISIVGFKYENGQIFLCDDCEEGEGVKEYLRWNGNLSKKETVGWANSADKELLEFKDSSGKERRFYKLGYDIERDDAGAMICVEAEEAPVRNGEYMPERFRCSWVKKMEVKSSGFGADEQGEYMLIMDDDYVMEVEPAPYWFNLESNHVYREDGDDYIELGTIDRRKAIADIAEGNVEKQQCLALIKELDIHNILGRSGIPEDRLVRLYMSHKVPCSWKYDTLSKISDGNADVRTIYRWCQRSSWRPGGSLIMSTRGKFR